MGKRLLSSSSLPSTSCSSSCSYFSRRSFASGSSSTTGSGDDDSEGEGISEITEDLDEAMSDLEAVREQIEEEQVDKEVELMISPDEILVGEEDDPSPEIPGSGTWQWLELFDVPKAAFPGDVSQFLAKHGVSPVKGESLRVKLSESLHIDSWYIPMKNQQQQLEGLRKLRDKRLGLLKVSTRPLTVAQATKLLTETETVLDEGKEYVSLTNVPNDTTAVDVKDFFRGYNVIGITELKKQKQGKEETARFIVRFTSFQEAYNAVQFKSHRPFFHRRAMVSLMFSTMNTCLAIKS